MDLRLFFITLSIIPIIEMCIPMIPPEDVYISSTAHTLPYQETTIRMTKAPITNEPVTDAPSLCDQCDIEAIKPSSTPPGTFFQSQEEAPISGCQQTLTVCQRTDDLVCTDSYMIATTPKGSVQIGDEKTPDHVFSTLSCNKDGTYSFGTEATQITRLECVFNNCKAPVQQCTQCNIDTIKPASTPSGVIFESEERAPAGTCKQTYIVCRRTDNQVCQQAHILATTPTGSVQIVDTKSESQVSATLNCANDGTYSLGTATQISGLTCVFENCKAPVEPCTQCNIDTIKPSSTPPGVVFLSEEQAPAGSCKKTRVVCRRTDDLVCSKVYVLATTPTEFVPISEVVTETEVSATLNCDNDGTYSFGFATQISALECVFENCQAPVVPCQKCKITDLKLNPGSSGAVFFTEELPLSNGCNQVFVRCVKNQSCDDIDLTGTTPAGTAPIWEYGFFSPSETEISTTLSCGNDGKYYHEGVTGINEVTCNVFNCM